MTKASFHESFAEDDQPVGPSDRSFGLTVGGILLAILAVRLLLGAQGWLEVGLAVFGVPLVLLALIRPGWLARPNRWWMRLGLLLFAIVNPIVMFLMYAVCIVPAGLVMKAIGRDPLARRFDPGKESYWIERKPAELDQPMTYQF